ncbi:hypothetical protein JCM10212_004254 [Sporobolomyces blumeae]
MVAPASTSRYSYVPAAASSRASYPTGRPPSPAPSSSPTSTRRGPSPARSRVSSFQVPPADVANKPSEAQTPARPKPSSTYRPPSPARSRASSPVPPRARSPLRTGSAPTPLLEVYGDSFCSVFTLLKERVRVHKFKGASARGLNNPASSLQVGQEIVRRIRATQPRHVLLQFGAVDLHLTYLWQLKSRGTAAVRPAEFVHLVVAEFCSYFLDEILPLAQAIGTRVFVAGVMPPVVEDRYLELAASKYLERTASAPLAPLASASQPHDLLTRRAMVKLHNQLMSQFCARYPSLVSFVEINPYLGSASEPERVSSRFVDAQDPTNIHLIWERTIQYWCRAIPVLRKILPSLESSSLTRSNLAKTLEAYEREKRLRMNHAARDASRTRGFAEGAAASRGRGW